jgi:translation initiation factor 1 (eIF-1/SUI1)
MDPFMENESTNIMFNELPSIDFPENVIIFAEKRGRRADTYIINLNNTEKEKLELLKSMKKKFGCNGSYKKVQFEGIEVQALHLQGDQIKKVKSFLIDLNITNLEIKELII